MECQRVGLFYRMHFLCSKAVNPKQSEQQAPTPSLEGNSASHPGQLVLVSVFCLVS